MRGTEKSHVITAWVCIVIGFYPLAIAVGILPVDPAKIHAPMWVVVICGLVFILAGCMILYASHRQVIDLLAALLLLLFGITGAWVAVFAGADAFSGGIPLLSDATNVILARFLFGAGAVLYLALSALALKRFVREQK